VDGKSNYASTGKMDLLQIQVADKVEEHVRNLLSKNLHLNYVLIRNKISTMG
jgi:hypothetical protein